MMFDFIAKYIGSRKNQTHKIHESIAAPVQKMLALLQSLDGAKGVGIRQKLFYSNLADSLKVAFKLSELLSAPKRLATIKARARRLGHPRAAFDVAKQALEMAGG